MTTIRTCPTHRGISIEHKPCYRCHTEQKEAAMPETLMDEEKETVCPECGAKEGEAHVGLECGEPLEEDADGRDLQRSESTVSVNGGPAVPFDEFAKLGERVSVTLHPLLLRAMAIFVHDDPENPILSGIHVALRPRSMQLTATDTYCAAIYREVISEDRFVKDIDCDLPVEFTVPVADIMPLLKLKLKNADGGDEPLAVTYWRGEITFVRGSWTVRLPTLGGVYPDLAKLFEGTDPQPLDGPVLGLGMPFTSFVEFAHTLKTASNMHLTMFGSNKIIGVRYCDSDALRDSFMGAIMPVKTGDDDVMGTPKWMQLQLVEQAA